MAHGSTPLEEIEARAAPRPAPARPSALAAFRELTILAPKPEPTIGVSALFYPLVGLFLGCMWVIADAAARLAVGPAWSSLFVLVVALLLTGGRTIVGAGRTLAAMLTPNRRRALALMEGPLTLPIIVSAVCVLALELICLVHVDRLRPLALASAPLLGRWSMVVLALGSRAARVDERRVKFAPAVSFREFGWASTLTFGLLFSLSGFLGVIIAVAAAFVIVGLRLLLHRRFGGISSASLGAACELTQLVPLAMIALL